MTDQTNALLVTVTDPFNTLKSRKLARLEVGRTIFETLVEQDYISMTETGVKRHGFFYVTLNGKAVLQKDWNTVISHDDCVGVWTLPQGGGGGSNIGVILITVVMVAAAVFTGGATLGVALAWGAAAGAAVGLLTSLVPAPATGGAGSSIGMDAASSTYTISAQGNTVRIGEAIPVQFGRMRVWPDLAAQPYTESRGNAQYLYQLMVLGQGNFEVEAIQIEDSNINAYGEIEYEIIRPGQAVTLFPDNVITSQAVQGLEMLAPDEEGFALLGPYVVSPPGVKTKFIAVDIQLPQGAYTIDNKGNNQPRTVQFQFSAQPITDTGAPNGNRVQIINETLTLSTKTPQILSFKVEVAEDRYQVDGQRLTSKASDNRTIDKVVWSGLKGYSTSARTFGNVTMLATVIKATNNLNSNTSRRINTIQTAMLPTWDPVNGWGPEVATANPAWAYAAALRNSEYGPGWGTNRINMAELYRLSQVWAARGDQFNGRFDTRSTLWQALSQIASVGRATPQYYAGVMDIVRDEPKTIPAQLFSPGQILQNTFKGSYKLGTSQTPDHVIVKFWNRETWQEDQVTCVLPGSTTKVPYTKDMTFGITDHDHAWREGMYAAAVNRDQRSRNSFTVEMSGLLLRFGDLIHVTHDVPGWGYPGKVISLNTATGKIVTTEPLVFAAGVNHYITFRKKNGQADGPWQIIADPNAVPGVNSGLIRTTAANLAKIYISNGVKSDLTTYAFGPADRESAKLVVLNAKPNAKGETQITVCDYVTSTHIADQGGDVPIPPPISNLPGAPVGPIINNVRVEMTTTVGEQQIVADPANGAVYYEFEGMRQGGGNWASFGVSGDPFLFVNLDAGPWIIRVRAYGSIPGPWATWSGEISLTSLPLARLSKFTATGKIFAIELAVDYTEETRSIADTLEIWAGRTNVLGNATLLARLPYPATTFIHNVNRGADQWFYFARVIDTANRTGPWWNGGVAVAGMSSADAEPILEQITGEVTKDILGQELQAEINLITADKTVIGSVNQRVEGLRTDVNQQILNLSTSLTADLTQMQQEVDQLDSNVSQLNQDVANINNQIVEIGKAGLYQANRTYAIGQSVRGTDDHLYTATKAVPINTPPPNTNYWLDVGQVAITENGSAVKITALTTRVTTVENTTTAQGQLITGLRTDVNGKASQVAFDALKSEVTVNGQNITAQGQAITNLTTTLGNVAGNGSNLLSDEYSWLASTTLPTTGGALLTKTGVAVAEAMSGFGYSLKFTDPSIFSYIVLAASNNAAGYNLELEPGTYLVSMYVKGDTAGQIQANLYDGTTSRVFQQAYTTERQRLTFPIVIPARTKAGLLVYPNRHGAASGGMVVDSIMVEKRIGENNTPSPFVAGPSARQISGLATATTALNTRVANVEGTASANSSAITSLQTNLTTTNNNVTAAQNAANAANTLAGGKGKVIYGSTTPAVADRLEQNIWIDTTGGANTPKRWNGTAWVAVTDKVATDAAAAAANALALAQTKADASAVTQLQTTVTQQGLELTSLGSSITAITATLSQQPDNLILKGIFEDGSVGPWTANPSISNVSAHASYSKAITFYANSFCGITFNILTQGGEQFDLSADVWNNYMTAGQVARLQMQFYDKTNTNLGYITGLTINAGANGFQTYTGRITAPAGAVSARFVVRHEPSDGSGRSLWCNMVARRVTQANIANANATTVLSGRVTQTETTITSQGSRITTLENTVNDPTNGLGSKASASSVAALSNRVTQTETDLTAVASNVTQLSTNLQTTNSNVTAAQNAANAANTLAGGKGKVIYGSTAPAVADRLEQNIWIDTTGNANTPKRWTGSAWVAVTDKVATDAAAAAANALAVANTKADASALSSLQSTVTQQGTTITSLGNSIINLEASINQQPDNLVPKGNFEDGTIGPWTSSGSVPTQVKTVTNHPSMGKAIAFYANSFCGTGRILMNAGDVFDISADVDRGNMSAGQTGNWQLQYFNKDNVSLGYFNAFTFAAAPAGFVTLTGRMTAPAGTTSGRVVTRIQTADAVGYSLMCNMVMRRVTAADAANAAATTALTTRVTQTETTLTSQGNSITQLSNSITTLTNTKADATALTALQTKVTQQGTTLTSQGQAVTVLENKIGAIGGTGNNLLSDEYSWLTSTTLPTTVGSSSVTRVGVAVAAAASGYGIQIGGLTTAGHFLMLSPSNNVAGWNIPIEPGVYLVSMYVQGSAAGSMRASLYDGTGRTSANIPYTTTRTRYTYPITVTDTTKAAITLYPNMTVVSGITVTIDSVMIEKRIGDSNTPSPFVAGPSARAVSAQAVAINQIDTKVTQQGTSLTAQITRIDNLTTTVGGNTTAINNEVTARTNADSALGQRIDTTNANLGTTNANVQVVTNAQAALQNQANASYAVKLGVTSNGIYYASGFGQSLVNNNGVLQSTFAVLTDRFVVLNSVNNTLVSPFSIVNGQVVIADAMISKLAVKNALIGESLVSQSTAAWAGLPTVVLTFAGDGALVFRHPTMANTYTTYTVNGIDMIISGIRRFRAGTW